MKAEELRYTKDHEWASRPQNGKCLIGISDHAQQELGDIVYVEEAQTGKTVAAGEACSTVESVKAASDIYSPLSGSICRFNSELGDNPSLVNEDPLGAGWLFELEGVEVSDWDSLMSYEDYMVFLKSL